MFRFSMRSRWEMQEGAELEDEEKTMVKELQNACCVSSSSQGKKEDPLEAEKMLKKETQRDTEPPG